MNVAGRVRALRVVFALALRLSLSSALSRLDCPARNRLVNWTDYSRVDMDVVFLIGPLHSFEVSRFFHKSFTCFFKTNLYTLFSRDFNYNIILP